MANKKVAAEILEGAIQFIEQGWTKYAVARDRYGRPVPFHDRAACLYCIDGAIARAAWDRADFVNDIIAIRTVEEQQQCRLETLNDELVRSPEEAVEVLRRGVEKLRGTPPRQKAAEAKPKRRRGGRLAAARP